MGEFEGGQSGLWWGVGEEEVDERHNHHKCEEVEEDGQHVEEEVGRYVPGVVFEVLEDPPYCQVGPGTVFL